MYIHLGTWVGNERVNTMAMNVVECGFWHHHPLCIFSIYTYMFVLGATQETGRFGHPNASKRTKTLNRR